MITVQAARNKYNRALQGLDAIVSQLPGDRPSPHGIIGKRERAQIEKAVKKQRIAFRKYMEAIRQSWC